MEQHDESRLSPEDLERVRKVTNTGQNAIERKPFRPFLLLGGVVLLLTFLSLLSVYVASLYV